MRDSRWRRAGGFGALLTGIALLVGMKLLSGAPAAGNPLAIPPSAQHGQPAAPVTPSGSASRPAPAGNRTVSGSVANTPYGPVQVRLQLSGGRIVDVQALQLPSGNDHSTRLAQMAAPILRDEVLSAQSAQIDTVSGATYTSTGYAESVQYALDHQGD